jgi:hypothetical protein
MKTIITIIVAIILIKSNGYAQCPINTISTDPNNYLNSSDPTGSKKWDWRLPMWNGYMNDGFGGNTLSEIENPFFSIGNPNTEHFLYDSPDFQPHNGWEFVVKEFGSASIGVQNPYFILYNRYTGLLRCFVQVSHNLSYNQSAKIELSFGTSTKISAALNQLGVNTFSVSNFKKLATHKAINEYVNNDFFWLYADFSTLYDPCTCKNKSTFNLTSNLISVEQISLSINGFSKTIISNTPTANTVVDNNFFTTIESYAEEVGSVLESGTKKYKNGQDIINSADSIIMNNSGIIGKETTPKVANFVGELLYELPNLLSYTGMASTTIKLIKKYFDSNNSDQTTQNSVSESRLKLEATGILTQSSKMLDMNFTVPGSIPLAPGASESLKPVYNNVLGVINLLELPKMEMVSYKVSIPGITLPSSVIGGLSRLYEYKVMTPLKYAVNPASKLKVKNIKACLVFEIDSILRPINPNKDTVLHLITGYSFEPTTNFGMPSEKAFNENGYTIEMFSKNANKYNGATVSTPYLSPYCFDKNSILLNRPLDVKKHNPRIRLQVELVPIDDNPSSFVKSVFFTYTYSFESTDLIPSTYNTPDRKYTLHSSSGILNPTIVAYNSPFTDVIKNTPYNLTLKNKVLSTDVKAIGTITIDSNVTVAAGANITIQAGDEIIVKNKNFYSPTVTFKTGIDNLCATVADAPASVAEINTKCNSSLYAALSNPTKETSPVLDSIAYNLEMNVFPNPTHDLCKVSFTLPESNEVVFQLADVYGRMLGEPYHRIYNKGENEFDFNVENLPPGFYLILMKFNGQSITKKIIKQ